MSDPRDPVSAAIGEWLLSPCPAKEMAQELRAILARHGLAVVPVEPTEAMIAALQSYAVCAGYIAEGYRAMVAAAQETKG